MNERGRANCAGKQIGFIFQSYTLLPTYSAYENVDLALRLPGIGYYLGGASAPLLLWPRRPDRLGGFTSRRVERRPAPASRHCPRASPCSPNSFWPTADRGLDSRTAKRILTLFGAIAASQARPSDRLARPDGAS